MFCSWDSDIFGAMIKNACKAKDNDLIIYLLRKMKSSRIEPSKETLEMINEYQEKHFQTQRTTRKVDKRTRNECFKLSRECKQWQKHFQNDKQTDPSPEEQTKRFTEAKTPKSDVARKAKVKTSRS